MIFSARAGLREREDGLFSTLYMPNGSGFYDTSNGHGAFRVSWPSNFLHINGF
jgi:hypothetical protein